MKPEAINKTTPVTPHTKLAVSNTYFTWSPAPLPPPRWPPSIHHDVSLEFDAFGSGTLSEGEENDDGDDADDDPLKNDIIPGDLFEVAGGGL